MNRSELKRPQAIAAVWLASTLHGLPSEVITRAVNASRVPHRLFAIATHLQQCAAQQSQGSTDS